MGLVDGVEVEQTLGRVHVGTVAGIDDRYRSYLAGILGGTLDEVAHGNDISIVAHHKDGVLECLALGGAGSLGVREAYDTSAKAVGCGLETKLSASRRLEEKGCDNLSLQQLPVRMLFKLLRHFQEIHQLLLGKVGNRHKIMFFHLNFD